MNSLLVIERCSVNITTCQADVITVMTSCDVTPLSGSVKPQRTHLTQITVPQFNEIITSIMLCDNFDAVCPTGERALLQLNDSV